jgi:hypothetical protein
MLGVFFSIACVELFVVHLLVALWSAAAAWALSALTLFGLAQIAMLVRGMIRWPTLIDDTRITIRHGRRSEILVPLDVVESVEDVAFQPEEKGPKTFRATVLAQPNLCIRVSPAVLYRSRALSTICLRLDEPSAFRAELEARIGTSSV